MSQITVEGIVAKRNCMPYVILLFHPDPEPGKLVEPFRMQISCAEARNIARDIEVQASRIEADAMLIKFFTDRDLPLNALGPLMMDFRNFRADIDGDFVEKTISNPSFDNISIENVQIDGPSGIDITKKSKKK